MSCCTIGDKESICFMNLSRCQITSTCLMPLVTLERSLQLIKGGFSFRARKELGFGGEIWQPSFYDRRVRDWQEYCAFREYIRSNPVKKRLVVTPERYPHGSANPEIALDAAPQRLKPLRASA
jgi:putative transposase